MNRKVISQNKVIELSQKFAFWILLFIWFSVIAFQLCKVFHTPIWRDDATFAQVAKNMVLGHGYAVASFDKLFSFAWGISSGPTVILPTSLMIMIFGNSYWVPGLTCILLINGLLLAIFVQLKSLMKHDAIRWECFSLFLLAAILFTNHLTGFPGEKMHVWHALMGDIPSALFVINAILYIAKNREIPKVLFTGGLIMSLGALCKMQALIDAGLFGVYLAIYYFACWRIHAVEVRRWILSLALYAAGIVLPLACFEVTKILCLGWYNYFSNNGQLNSVSHAVLAFANMEMVCKKICELSEYLGLLRIPPTVTLPFKILLVSMIFIYIRLLKSYALIVRQNFCSYTSAAQWAADGLLFCAIGHTLWWIFLSPVDMPRYATQGLLYASAGMVLILSRQINENIAKGTRNLLILVVMVVGLRYDAIIYLATALEENKNLAEQQEIVQKLESIKQIDPNTVLFSCGYTFELEYLLKDSANFVRCEKIDDPAYSKNDKLLLSFTIDNSGLLLDYDDSKFHVIFHPNLMSARMACPSDDLFSSHHYFLASCPRS